MRLAQDDFTREIATRPKTSSNVCTDRPETTRAASACQPGARGRGRIPSKGRRAAPWRGPYTGTRTSAATRPERAGPDLRAPAQDSETDTPERARACVALVVSAPRDVSWPISFSSFAQRQRTASMVAVSCRRRAWASCCSCLGPRPRLAHLKHLRRLAERILSNQKLVELGPPLAEPSPRLAWPLPNYCALSRDRTGSPLRCHPTRLLPELPPARAARARATAMAMGASWAEIGKFRASFDSIWVCLGGQLAAGC